MIKETQKYVEELATALKLTSPIPVFYNEDGEGLTRKKFKVQLRESQECQLEDKIRHEKWQGKLLDARCDDESLIQRNCFAWLKKWPTCPSHTIAGMFETLLPRKLYTAHKTRTSPAHEVPHVLPGYYALAQNKYLERHNASAFPGTCGKIVFF